MITFPSPRSRVHFSFHPYVPHVLSISPNNRPLSTQFSPDSCSRHFLTRAHGQCGQNVELV